MQSMRMGMMVVVRQGWMMKLLVYQKTNTGSMRKEDTEYLEEPSTNVT
jgi:hypothetical protein